MHLPKLFLALLLAASHLSAMTWGDLQTFRGPRIPASDPKSLAQGDWTGDGVPDLLVGSGQGEGGLLEMFPGRESAIYPWVARRAAERDGRPFDRRSAALILPFAPDLLVAGNFDGDEHLDAAFARRGTSMLGFVHGVGTKRPLRVEVLRLEEPVSALAIGELGRHDGDAELFVGVGTGKTSQALIFMGGMRPHLSSAIRISMSEAVLSFAVGLFSSDSLQDLAILTHSTLTLAFGGGTLDRPIERVEPQRIVDGLPVNPFALVAGRIADGLEGEQAQLVVAGMDQVSVLSRVQESWTSQAELAVIRTGTQQVAQPDSAGLILVPGAFDTEVGLGWIVHDLSTGMLSLAAPLTKGTGIELQAASISSASGVKTVAVLPMRLNADGLSDLVLLRADGTLQVLPSASAVFTVNSNNDADDGSCNAGHCSLREAIRASNTNSGADTIAFNIPGAGVKTIAPTVPLPQVTDTVAIDATTQPGYAGSPLIQLNGANLLQPDAALHLNASNSVVRGFAINRFINGCGVRLESAFTPRSGNLIESNRIGTNVAGTSSLPNSCGVTVLASIGSSTVGGTAMSARNIISGNNGNGVSLNGSSGLKALNNLIGLNASQTAGIVNSGSGILVGSSNATIGAGAGNVIGANYDGIEIINFVSGTLLRKNVIGVATVGGPAANPSRSGIRIEADNSTVGSTNGAGPNTISLCLKEGVKVVGGTGNLIRYNSISGNGGIGINLVRSGELDGAVTPNDALDADAGPNRLQNYPVVTSAIGSNVGVSLQAARSTSYTVDIFDAGGCDPSGFGEGKNRIGGGLVTTDFNGNAAGTFLVSGSVSSGMILTATATDAAANTSEFSPCFSVP